MLINSQLHDLRYVRDPEAAWSRKQRGFCVNESPNANGKSIWMDAMTVLSVEHQRDSLDMLKFMLEGIGYEVMTVTNPKRLLPASKRGVGTEQNQRTLTMK